MIILTSQIDKDKRVLKTIKENLQDDKMFLFIASDRENLKGNIEYMNKRGFPSPSPKPLKKTIF